MIRLNNKLIINQYLNQYLLLRLAIFYGYNSIKDYILYIFMNNAVAGYYEILGVETHSSREDIKRAYRRQSLLYHPDKHNDEPEKIERFRLINDAYLVLSDNALRSKYDRDHNINNINNRNNINNIDSISRDNGIIRDQCEYHNSINDERYSTSNHQLTGQPRSYNNKIEYNTMRKQSRPVLKPKNIELVQPIDLRQSYYGANIPLNISRVIREGSRYQSMEDYQEVQNQYNRINETETVYIEIPPGTDDGEIIVIKEKGNIMDGVSGDIRVKIKLNFESMNGNGNNMFMFYREGLNLVYTKTITFKESICGFSFCLKHINGRQYTINNNTGIVINPNSTTVIPKLGFNKSQGTRQPIRGDLIIKYIIDYPERIDGATRDRLSEIL